MVSCLLQYGYLVQNKGFLSVSLVETSVTLLPDLELPVAETREDKRLCRTIKTVEQGLKRQMNELTCKNEILVNDVKRRMTRKEMDEEVVVLEEAVVHRGRRGGCDSANGTR